MKTDKTKPFLIGIDGNEANVRNRVGIGRYAFELLREFKKLSITSAFKAKNFQFLIYLKEKPLLDLPKEEIGWEYRVVGPKKFWTQIGLPLALLNDCHLKGRQIKVFFTPTHYAPRFSPCPRVISIMDLSFLYFPRMFKKNDLWQLKNWTAYSVKKANKILTISRASKNDIIRYYQVPEEKVVVTYPGISQKMEISSSKFQMIDLRKKYGIEGDYILSVGTLQPRKNYVRLIEAFSTLDFKNQKLFLVIIGKKGWLYEEILAAPKKFGIEKKVKFLDYVPDSELPAFYQNAKCFILVSLYEGFGLPVLEAMSYGCPVIVSNVSSLPEVVGEAGILVDPNSVFSIAQGIQKVLNFNTSEYEKYIRLGREQAKKFSWEKCAKETLKVLEEVVQNTR